LTLWDYGFRTTRTDYEGELAVIISKRATQVAKADAYDHIYGYTCFNDVSQRNFQKHDKAGWFRGKSLDTFGPIGPSIVLHDDLGDPQNLTIQTRLNGDVVQDSNTRNMIFPIAETIAFISKQITLEAGDIIATGTPDGVGPLKNGDVVEVEIEKIGILRNSVQAPH
jgi:2-keto-4-pentenoate hydratase/2-oxohepta-3-ene-1,7-dioic acid hydratase in catechol pathway